MERHPALLDRSSSVLVVIDMQEAFLNVIHGREALISNVHLLCRSAVMLGIPIIATTQNAARIGPLIPALTELRSAASNPVEPIDKLSFSCAGSELFDRTLSDLSRKQVVLCGLETHICVSQTAHDLLHAGYSAHVAVDASSSRSMERHKLGMERIRDAGILPVATEAAVFEWLREAGTPEFKELLPLIR